MATLGDVFLATVKNWDADAAKDGIEFTFEPKDITGRQVNAEGTISATLWKKVRADEFSFEYVKGPVIKEWNNVNVKRENYGFFGATVRLGFDESYIPDQFDSGVLGIKFETQGKTFETETDVLLGY